MKPIVSFLLTLGMLACTTETKESDLSPSVVVPERTTPIPRIDDPEEERAPEPGPCEKFETAQFNLPDGGGTVKFRVPLPCDPLWYLKDHGDPPPMDPSP